MSWYVAAVLILVVAVILQFGLLAYAMYALLAVLIVSRYLATQWVTQLRAERECSRATAEEGDQVAVVVTVTNTGWLPIVWVLIEDLLPRKALVFRPPYLEVDGRRAVLTMLRAGGTQFLRYQMRCHRRGYYQIGPLILETGDVFGLHRRYRVAAPPVFLTVYPRTVPLQGYQIASRRPIGEVRMTHRLYEDPTRQVGVRQYQPGDSLGRVHWPATARTGILHSKIYEPSTVAGATIVLDLHQDANPAHNEPYRSELAVTAAVSLANAVYEMGQQVGLVSNGRDAADRVRTEGWAYDWRSRDAARLSAEMQDESDRLTPVVVPTRRGEEQFLCIRDALARVELTDGLTLPQLLDECAGNMPRDATVLVIVQDVSDVVAISIDNLRRQGFSVSVVLNIYEPWEFSIAAGPLIAAGIDVHHLRDEASIVAVAERFLLR
ncbi:MAG: DUF58 domain-containing protein [Pirellulaceae bacterium]|nr:DUF58 domain-containing protein [Planctomycetales bacterium]